MSQQSIADLSKLLLDTSHFHMVELADFIAYLDLVISGLEDIVLKWHKCEETEKTTGNQILYELINSLDLFGCDTRTLSNVFVEIQHSMT